MQGLIMLSGFLVAFGVSALVCRYIVRHGRYLWLDHPDERSLHSAPVSRLGGAGIWGGVAIGAVIGWSLIQHLLSFDCIVAALLLLLVALVDDWKALQPLSRILVQIAAVLLTVFGARLYFHWDMAVWIWPWVGVFTLLWGINLYNFMDGMDGFAGTMAVIGFSALAVLGLIDGRMDFAFLCGLIVSASTGFLVFNFPPARIFMGDSGSTVLGFAMVVVAVLGWKEDIYPFWMPLVIFSPFWIDATVTLLKRVAKGEKIWLPHRQHLYQRWVLAGYTHRQVTVAYCLLMVACAFSVITWQTLCQGYNAGVITAFWGLFYCLSLIGCDRVLAAQKRESR